MRKRTTTALASAGFLVGVGGLLAFDPLVLAQQVPANGGVTGQLLRDARRDGRRVMILTEDLYYCYPPANELYKVPAFFETDFASIPTAARWMINPFGDHAEAAVVHDWLYAVGEEGGRLKADEVFRFAMAEQGVNVLTRNAMFRAVRAGGGAAYGQNREWRFVDPRNGQPVESPPRKPAKAVVGQTDCATFDTDIARLKVEYADVYR